MLWSLVLDTEDCLALEVDALDMLPVPLVTVVSTPLGFRSDEGCANPGKIEIEKIDNDNKLVAPTLMMLDMVALPRLWASRRFGASIVPLRCN
jgi:hypothetical protein